MRKAHFVFLQKRKLTFEEVKRLSEGSYLKKTVLKLSICDVEVQADPSALFHKDHWVQHHGQRQSLHCLHCKLDESGQGWEDGCCDPGRRQGFFIF